MTEASLPVQATSFVGRVEELAEISTLLSDPNCRLLTVMGPGGIGKTRLALQAMVEQRLHFADGVGFVPFAPVSSVDQLASALANALQLALYGLDDPAIQVIRYLRERQMLLVLDNFEHLLAGASLLTEILQAAPDVKLLVTSRERLNLQEEWALTLNGLDFPEAQATAPLESYSAVQLFVQRARQIQGKFSLSENAEAVKIICQRAEGLPLGLELAATWLRAMTCRQIAEQMKGSIDFLTTPMRNLPERHRSLRAVFEQSWSLLAESEQQALMRFSIFRGGFDLEAAEQIAGAALPLLAGLADKSLIRLNANGRYDLHELLRQYAADKLDKAGLATATADDHLNYFMKLGEQAEAHEYGREQTIWYDRLETELDNIRMALAWAEKTARIESGLRLASAIFWFWDNRAHWWEGHDWLVRLLSLDRGVPPSLRAKALNRAAEIGVRLRDTRSLAFPNEALALAYSVNDEWNIAWSLASLGRQHHYARLTTEAGPLFDQSLALFRKLGDRLGLSHLLRRRGWNALLYGEYAYARLLLEESFAHAREAGAKNALAWTHHIFALLISSQDHDFDEAAAQLQESLKLFQELEDIGAVTEALDNLGVVEYRRGNASRSAMFYEKALLLRQRNGIEQSAEGAYSLAGLGYVAAMQGNLERAVRLLAAAEGYYDHFWSFEPFHKDFETLRAQLDATAFAEAWAEGKAMTWKQATAYALQHDTVSEEASLLPKENSQPLDEPLSARELEVLRLVAEGLSNAEIAQKLFISVATVKVHAGNIYGKLGVNNRTHAVTMAQKLNLL